MRIRLEDNIEHHIHSIRFFDRIYLDKNKWIDEYAIDCGHKTVILPLSGIKREVILNPNENLVVI